MQIMRASLLIFSILAISACSSLKFPGVYRIPIQQGNYIEEEMVQQLEKGMTKRQVRYILGSPMVEDTFNQDRWDYFYNVKRGDTTLPKNHLIFYFDGDSLTRWEGEYTADTKQLDAEREEALENTRKKEEAKFD